jgi:hypothetical protein
MPPAEVFADLVAFGASSVVHVRVWQVRTDAYVALVVDPEDNPGLSAINGAEVLHRYLTERWVASKPIRMFVSVHSPRAAWTEYAPEACDIGFVERTHKELERILGRRVQRPPLDATCAQLGGLTHPLVATLPEPEPARDLLAALAVVAVAELPFPHNPFRCRHHARFELLAAARSREARETGKVGREWAATLTEADFDACPRHVGDWLLIARTSVEALRVGQAAKSLNACLEHVIRVLGDTPEAEWCVALFADPITWSPGRASATDGQHRICALRAAGAPQTVVECAG